jgi:regulator of PEP synthase PpsR (kinase-PPPase family)
LAKKVPKKGVPPPVYIVSGGSGASGQLVAETALAQFPTLRVSILIRNHVGTLKQVETALKEARAHGGIVIHTLVDRDLREALIRLGRKHGVETIDLMGPLIEHVVERTGATPLGQPGMYRKLRKEYFDRVDAIDFAVSHDDGNKPDEIASADVVITGVSRCGKTPLSMYLAVHGWKVANIPIVRGIPLPGEIFRIDRHKVVGLTIELRRLLEFRKKREETLGTAGPSDYSNPSAICGELETAKQIYRDGGFCVVEVTDKPIEATASEIIKIVTAGPNRERHRHPPY